MLSGLVKDVSLEVSLLVFLWESASKNVSGSVGSERKKIKS